MAKTYKASLDVSVWKQHTCVSCRTKYRYHLERKATGQGNDEAAALEAASTAAETLMNEDVDIHPCPVCGCVQPDMVSSQRTPYYGWAVVIALIGVAVALATGLAHGFPIGTSAVIAASSVGAGLLISFLGSARNPNGSLAANVMRAQESVDSKTLFVDERGAGAQEDPSSLIASPFSGRGLLGLLLYAALVVVAAMPLVMATVNGWTANENWYPAVVGPGDQSTLYLTQTLRSVKGYWNGGASAVVSNAADLGQQPGLTLSGTTNDSRWGDRISGKSVSSQTNRVWITFQIPPTQDLAGKPLDLDVTAHLSFPEEEGGGFVNANRSFQEKARVALSSPGAGTAYFRAFWTGLTATLVGLVVAWLLLSGAAGAVRALALPATVTPYEPDAPVFDA